jgi:hypothetical protein
MFWVIVMVKSQVFQQWLSDVLDECLQNMFVYAAYDKMKISHSDAAMHPHTITLQPPC